MTRSKVSRKTLPDAGVGPGGEPQSRAQNKRAAPRAPNKRAAPRAPKYRLQFVKDALREWNALDGSVKEPLRKLLRKRLDQPRMPGAELAGDLLGCYKIKLRRQGYRLVYQVNDGILLVLVLAVDKREDNLVYASAAERRNTSLMVQEPAPAAPTRGASGTSSQRSK